MKSSVIMFFMSRENAQTCQGLRTCSWVEHCILFFVSIRLCIPAGLKHWTDTNCCPVQGFKWHFLLSWTAGLSGETEADAGPKDWPAQQMTTLVVHMDHK